MKARFCLTISLYLTLSTTVYSQITQDELQNQSIEDLIEEIASNSDVELDYTTLFDDLYYYARYPMNINAATETELRRLHFLSDYQINAIIEYREKYGNLLSIYELAMIDGFTSTTDIRHILPFIEVKPIAKQEKLQIKDAFLYSRHQVFLRFQGNIEKAKAYKTTGKDSTSHYTGNRWKYYTRYASRYKDRVAWGVTAEKDAGEAFGGVHQPTGFDYYTGFVQLNDIGHFKTLLAGDYQLQFGQGLVMWSGMGFGKNAYTLNINKKGQGLKKYSSTNENQFLRGFGTTIELGNFNVSVFGSYKKIDANFDETQPTDSTEVTSLPNTGYHRTLNELQDKDAIKEYIAGTNIAYIGNGYRIGLNMVGYGFDHTLLEKPRIYQKFDFNGKRGWNASMDYQLFIKKVSAFGEAAVSPNGAFALINGVVYHLHTQIGVAILHRYYQKDYQSYLSNAFGEGSHVSNEKGLYAGVEFLPYKYWKLSAYFDAYRFDWLRYQTDAPSAGADYFIQCEYNPKRSLQMYWRMKRELKPQNNNSTATGITPKVQIDNLQLRYHIAYALNRSIRLKNRIEYRRYKHGDTESQNGYLVYQDIKYVFTGFPLQVTLRFAQFETDTYNARIYSYENDVLYSFSIPAYYDKGSRFYLLFKYQPDRNLALWCRIDQTFYSSKPTVGTGWDEIDKKRKTGLKLQLRLKF